MPIKKKKRYQKSKEAVKRDLAKFNRTGEDIDMLNDRRMEQSKSYASSSSKYKDHIDGA